MRDVAALIVESLQLEVLPADIVPNAALFGAGMAGNDHSGGLGLDSIDALELALAISRKYGFDLKSDDERNQQIFASLENLTRTIEQRRTR